MECVNEWVGVTSGAVRNHRDGSSWRPVFRRETPKGAEPPLLTTLSPQCTHLVHAHGHSLPPRVCQQGSAGAISESQGR